MSKRNRVVRHVAINTFFITTLYFGLFENVEGALNAALFMAWICIFVSFFGLTDGFQKEIKEKNLPTIPRSIDVAFDLVVSGLFVWFGWWITGICYFIQILLLSAAYDEAKKTA